MCAELTDPMVATIKDAAAKLTGHPRRAFQAKVTLDYLGGSARRAETVFGWGREAVQRGLWEFQGLQQASIVVPHPQCHDARGRRKTEERLSRLEEDIRSLVEPQSQVANTIRSNAAGASWKCTGTERCLIRWKKHLAGQRR